VKVTKAVGVDADERPLVDGMGGSAQRRVPFGACEAEEVRKEGGDLGDFAVSL
jgi:hypothetical protein